MNDKANGGSIFSSFTDREIAEAIAVEMGRRKLNGCIFMYPETGGPAVFASSSPPGTISHLRASEQLLIFSDVASEATGEKPTMLPKNTESKGWIN